METLDDIYAKHGTDKGNKVDRYGNDHHYGDFYEMFFGKYKGSHINILELGIQHGYSMLAHEEYFGDVDIYGVDIDLSALEFNPEDHPKLHTILGSSTDPLVYTKLADRKYDIIIDDANHFHDNMVMNLAMYSKLVADGGVYVIEDLHCDFDSFFNEMNDGAGLILNLILRHVHSNLLTEEDNRELLSSIQQVFVYEYVNNSDIILDNPCKGSSVTAVLKFMKR